MLGYRHYQDEVVDRFVQKSAENGIDVFRVFDALNDLRNLERSIRAVKRTGFRTRLDPARLLRVKQHFSRVQPRYSEFLSTVSGVETEIFKSQIPGGMLSNMESQAMAGSSTTTSCSPGPCRRYR